MKDGESYREFQEAFVPLMKISTRQEPRSHDHSLQAVYFEYLDPAAHSVAIAGTFNDWRPQVTPMVNMGNGRWRKVLAVTPGTYEYTFVVDGRWVEERRTKQTSDGTQPPPSPERQPGPLPAEHASRKPRSPASACQDQPAFRPDSRFV
jgi:1,4-alpha-glucan branching enzyme